jgi:hypothetical protein
VLRRLLKQTRSVNFCITEVKAVVFCTAAFFWLKFLFGLGCSAEAQSCTSGGLPGCPLAEKSQMKPVFFLRSALTFECAALGLTTAYSLKELNFESALLVSTSEVSE